MSINQSHLSNYGYDFIIATSQASINKVLKAYLKNANAPEIVMYYNMQRSGDSTPIDRATLLTQTGGVDPFDIPAWNGDGDMPDDVAKIASRGCSFWYAFKAKIGLPAYTDAAAVPDVISMNAGDQYTTFRLLCSEFTIVKANFISGNLTSYENASQPKDAAWMFTSSVKFAGINSAVNLPSAVNSQVSYLQNTGNTNFSVQQLMLDLDDTSLETVPAFTGVTDTDGMLSSALSQVFTGTYFSALKANGAPVLGYAITQPGSDNGTLKLSYVALEADPFVDAGGVAIKSPTADQQKLFSLNYLCAANGNSPKASEKFPWNWLENNATDSAFDGVIAINRNTLRDHFKKQLDSIVSNNCFTPYVRVSLDWLSRPSYSFSMTSGGAPNVNLTESGATVLSYSWNPAASHDVAGAGGGIGQATLQPSFSCIMNFSGNTIVITQHLVVYAWVKHLATSQGGNVIDKTITDTYTLSIDPPTAKIKMVRSQAYADNSQSPNTNGFLDFFTGVNSLVDGVKSWLAGFATSAFNDVPLSLVQSFCFPGGNTFELIDIMFSDNQDLVSHINYADPSVSIAAERAIALKNANADSIGVAAAMKNEGFRADQIASGIKYAWNCFPKDVAYAMRAVGYTLFDISNSLKSVFGIGAQEVSNTYKTLGYTPNEIAINIKDAFNGDSIAVACIMKAAGFAINDIAGSIRVAWNCFTTDVSYAMKAAGYSLADISGGLKAAFGATEQSVCNTFKCLGYATDDIAKNIKAVYNGDSIAVATIMNYAGCSSAEIASGIKNTWNCQPGDVTYAMKAVGFTADDVSYCLRNLYNISAQDVTGVFKTMGYTPDDIAGNIKDVYGGDSIAVATIMKQAGYAPDDIATGIKDAWNCQPQDVIYAMRAAGYALTDISNSLKDVFKSNPQDVTNAFRALHYTGDEAAANIKNAFGGDSIAVAAIMKQAGYSTDEVAGGIKDAWNCFPVDVIYGMRGAGYALDDISNSLKNVFGINVQDAANAFKQLNYPALDVVKDLKNAFNQDVGFTVCIMTDAGYAQSDITAGIRSVWYQS